MKKETINIKRKETSIKLQASEINSIRVKDIERNAVRVYEKGYIGISGAIGDVSEEVLKKQAIKNLASKIPYPYALETNRKDHRCYKEKEYSETELMELTEQILGSLNEKFNDFIFSESIKTIYMDYRFKNSEGLDLRYEDEHLELGFIVKAKSSPNLFDSELLWEGRNLDVDKFLSFASDQLLAERTKVDLPGEGRIPVFFLTPDSLIQFLMRQLNGEAYGNKVSLFDGKIGEKLFNEKLTIVQNNKSKMTYAPFFDREGVTNLGDSISLVEDGVLERVFTDKKNAKKFNLEHTGSATGGYDDIPSLGFTNIEPEVDSENIQETLNGEKAIFVMIAAGGDFNADGHYATPVQSSYLFDGKKFLGKLPNFNMSNTLYKILGKDYIGTFLSEDLYFGDTHKIFGCYMNIKQ
jgi:PmbA protein